MWKILTGLAPNDLQISFFMNQRGAIKASVPSIPNRRSNTASYDKSFAVLGPKLWNLLPSDCSLKLDTLDSFKSSIGSFLKQFPDFPPTNGYLCPNSNSILDWASSNSTTWTSQLQ